MAFVIVDNLVKEYAFKDAEYYAAAFAARLAKKWLGTESICTVALSNLDPSTDLGDYPTLMGIRDNFIRRKPRCVVIRHGTHALAYVEE